MIDKETREEWAVQLRMRVAITQYESVEQAHELIQQPFQRGPLVDGVQKPILFAVGDEGYKEGFRYNHIVFRRGRYVFNVSASATPDFGEENKRGLATGVVEELAKEIAEELTNI